MAKAEDEGRNVCGVDGCGGPTKGRLFPGYKGPLTAGVLATHCYVCGEEAGVVISMPDLSRSLACCERHLHFLNRDIDRAIIKPEDRGIVTTRRVPVSLEEMLGLEPPKEDEG
jgi:hypothetical protein